MKNEGKVRSPTPLRKEILVWNYCGSHYCPVCVIIICHLIFVPLTRRLSTKIIDKKTGFNRLSPGPTSYQLSNFSHIILHF